MFALAGCRVLDTYTRQQCRCAHHQVQVEERGGVDGRSQGVLQDALESHLVRRHKREDQPDGAGACLGTAAKGRVREDWGQEQTNIVRG